jgi:hypothetical protein
VRRACKEVERSEKDIRKCERKGKAGRCVMMG